MVADAIAGLGALKTAFDLAKGLKDIDNAVSRNGAVIELQERILAAQQAQSALLEQIGTLEAKVASFENWESEKQDYELRQLEQGGFAYVLKPEKRDGKPPHGLCPNCYEQRRKSILQTNGEPQWTEHFFKCPSCKVNVTGYKNDFKKIFEPS
jgi:hypothetical protein